MELLKSFIVLFYQWVFQMAVKIIASVGPSSLGAKTIKQMFENGLFIARLKSSFFSPASLEKTIKLIRKNSGARIMVDLEGSEIRLHGKKSRAIKKGSGVWVGFGQGKGFSFNHDFFGKISIGDVLVYDKGARFVVKKKNASQKKIFLRAVKTTVLSNGKGFNSGKKTLVEGKLSTKDLRLIAVTKKLGVEILALSFTQSAADVQKLRKLAGKKAKICSKIENHNGLKNMSEITRVSDLVVVARGDLSAEFSRKKVSAIQKRIISVSKKLKKPVIVASYIFSSMKSSPVPLGREVRDVLNIAKEGADMVWMDSPTASGNFPAETVRAANETLKKAKRFS